LERPCSFSQKSQIFTILNYCKAGNFRERFIFAIFAVCRKTRNFAAAKIKKKKKHQKKKNVSCAKTQKFKAAKISSFTVIKFIGFGVKLLSKF